MKSCTPTRTSATHPITLSRILTWKGGSLGLCFCPGKCVTRDGVKHKRSLKQDLAHLREHHAVTCVLCLLNAAELRSFGLRDYAPGIQQAGLLLLNFPIIEMAAPICIKETHRIILEVAQLMDQGHHVAVHCRGGVGRAGLIAACALLYIGEATTGKDAINLVRQRRCKSAVETSRQEDFVCKYAQLCQHDQMLHQKSLLN